jgi:hypothetical protein
MEVGRASGREHAPASARKKIDRSIPTGLEGYVHHGSSPTRRIDEMPFECDRSFLRGHPNFIRSAPWKKAGGSIPLFRPTIGNVKENCR